MGDDARNLLVELCAEFNSARVRAGLTTDQLADAAGVSAAFIEAIESGRRDDLIKCAAVAAMLGHRLAIVEDVLAVDHGSKQHAGEAESVGAAVLQLPRRDKFPDVDAADREGLPGVW